MFSRSSSKLKNENYKWHEDLNKKKTKTGGYIMTTSEKQRFLSLLKAQILCELSNNLSQRSKIVIKSILHFWRVDSSFLNYFFLMFYCIYISIVCFIYCMAACNLCKLTYYVRQLLTSVFIKNLGMLWHCLNARGNIINM